MKWSGRGVVDMAIQLAHLKDHVEMVWGARHDPRLQMGRVINDAGRYLFGMHSWAWRERPAATLGVTADQAYVALPSDFGYGEVVDIAATDSLTFYHPQVTSLGELEHMRQYAVPVALGFYWYALSFPTQTATTAAPGNARLELYPTPASTVADQFKLIYRSGWVELSSDSAVANVPLPWEGLLIQLCRALAAERDLREHPGVPRVADIEQDPQVQRLKRMDGATVNNIGDIEGGVLRAGRPWDHNVAFDATGP